jgi:hypothetical protein
LSGCGFVYVMWTGANSPSSWHKKYTLTHPPTHIHTHTHKRAHMHALVSSYPLDKPAERTVCHSRCISPCQLSNQHDPLCSQWHVSSWRSQSIIQQIPDKSVSIHHLFNLSRLKIFFFTFRLREANAKAIQWLVTGRTVWSSKHGGCKKFVFPKPVQTGPGADSASCTMDTGSLLRGKAAGAWRWPPNPNQSQGWEWVQLYEGYPESKDTKAIIFFK